MPFDRDTSHVTQIGRLRLWILAVLVLGLAGTGVELVLLEHYEEPLQLVPLTLIALMLATLAWYAARPGGNSRITLIGVMAVAVLSGFVGFLAHFGGSAEFQRELDPEIATWPLLLKVLHAKAPPLLAPGMMIQMGLLGLAYVYSDTRRSEAP